MPWMRVRCMCMNTCQMHMYMAAVALAVVAKAEAERAEGACRWPVDEDLIRSGGSGEVGCGRG